MIPKSYLFLISISSFLAFSLWTSNQAGAQNWSINQSPVSSVPQYIPRYPLEASPNGADNQRPATLHTKPRTNGTKVVPKPTPTAPKLKRPPAKPPAKKPSASKSASTKKNDRKGKKEPEETKPHYGVDYSVHRDRNIYPIDPRKPCNPCAKPYGDQCSGCGGKLRGNQGRPYMETEPGGCTCQKKKPTKHPMFSVHWPRPFSAWLDERHPEKAAARYSPCQEPRCIDALNHLSTLKLSSYRRTDNAFSGCGADPYGCLSESKQAMRIASTIPTYYHHKGAVEPGAVELVGVTAGNEPTEATRLQPETADLDSVGERIGNFGWPTMR